MVDQDLLIIFIALTALAIVIQTGLLVGVYLIGNKMSRQANRAVEETQNFFGPMNRFVESLEAASTRLAEFSASAQGSSRELHLGLARVQESWRQTLNRVVRPGA